MVREYVAGMQLKRHAGEGDCIADRRCCGNWARCRVRLCSWMPRLPVAPRDKNVDDAGPAENVAPAVVLDLSMLLHLDLLLAAEHVDSIRGLLEIARQHQQPTPTSALTNLELLSKHLGEMQRRVETASGGTAAKSTISAFAHRREIPSPLHPQPPSFGCRVSPSDRSTPSD